MAEEDYKPGMLPYPEQDERKLFCKFHYKGVLIILIPLLFAPILLWDRLLPSRMLYISICVYLYYIFNVMPPGAIAFIFIVFLPILGITGSNGICMAQYSDLVFITYGCVFLGAMMDISKLSERLGMLVLGLCGAGIRLMVFLIMALAMITSLLTNSAFAAAVWMKITQAIVAQLGNAGILGISSEEEPYERQSEPYPSSVVTGIYLSVAYATTLGAMVSPFQEPNALIFTNMSSDMTVDLGYMLCLFIGPMIGTFCLTFLWLNIIFLGLFWGNAKAEIKAAKEGNDTIKQALSDKRGEMGPWSAHSIIVLIMLIFTSILLITRRPLLAKGWNDVINKDCGSSVAMIVASIICFSVAANYMFCRYYCCQKPGKEGTSPSLVNWKAANANTPWGHIFMMTAGLGFMTGFMDSQSMSIMCAAITDRGFGNASCYVVGTLLGILMSNLAPAASVARATIPPIVALNGAIGVDVIFLAVPYVANIHNQFLLPISTSGNTIVAGWGNIRPYQFLLGGCVPTLVMGFFLFIAISIAGAKCFTGFG